MSTNPTNETAGTGTVQEAHGYPFGITVRFPPNSAPETRLHVAIVLATYDASDVCDYQASESMPALVAATVPAANLHRLLTDLPSRIFVHYGTQEFHR